MVYALPLGACWVHVLLREGMPKGPASIMPHFPGAPRCNRSVKPVQNSRLDVDMSSPGKRTRLRKQIVNSSASEEDPCEQPAQDVLSPTKRRNLGRLIRVGDQPGALAASPPAGAAQPEAEAWHELEAGKTEHGYHGRLRQRHRRQSLDAGQLIRDHQRLALEATAEGDESGGLVSAGDCSDSEPEAQPNGNESSEQPARRQQAPRGRRRRQPQQREEEGSQRRRQPAGHTHGHRVQQQSSSEAGDQADGNSGSYEGSSLDGFINDDEDEEEDDGKAGPAHAGQVFAADEEDEGADAEDFLDGLAGRKARPDVKFLWYLRLRLRRLLRLSLERTGRSRAALCFETDLRQRVAGLENLEGWRRADKGLKEKFLRRPLLHHHKGGHHFGIHCAVCRHDRHYRTEMVKVCFHGRMQDPVWLSDLLTTKPQQMQHPGGYMQNGKCEEESDVTVGGSSASGGESESEGGSTGSDGGSGSGLDVDKGCTALRQHGRATGTAADRLGDNAVGRMPITRRSARLAAQMGEQDAAFAAVSPPGRGRSVPKGTVLQPGRLRGRLRRRATRVSAGYLSEDSTHEDGQRDHRAAGRASGAAARSRRAAVVVLNDDEEQEGDGVGQAAELGGQQRTLGSQLTVPLGSADAGDDTVKHGEAADCSQEDSDVGIVEERDGAPLLQLGRLYRGRLQGDATRPSLDGSDAAGNLGSGTSSGGTTSSEGGSPDGEFSADEDSGVDQPRKHPRVGLDCFSRRYTQHVVQQYPVRLDRMLKLKLLQLLNSRPEPAWPSSLDDLAQAVVAVYGHPLYKHYKEMMYHITGFDLRSRCEDRESCQHVRNLDDLLYAKAAQPTESQKRGDVDITTALQHFQAGAAGRAGRQQWREPRGYGSEENGCSEQRDQGDSPGESDSDGGGGGGARRQRHERSGSRNQPPQQPRQQRHGGRDRGKARPAPTGGGTQAAATVAAAVAALQQQQWQQQQQQWWQQQGQQQQHEAIPPVPPLQRLAHSQMPRAPGAHPGAVSAPQAQAFLVVALPIPGPGNPAAAPPAGPWNLQGWCPPGFDPQLQQQGHQGAGPSYQPPQQQWQQQSSGAMPMQQQQWSQQPSAAFHMQQQQQLPHADRAGGSAAAASAGVGAAAGARPGPQAHGSPAARRPYSQRGACHRCGQAGHWARECPNPHARDKCYRCGQLGHWSQDCPDY